MFPRLSAERARAIGATFDALQSLGEGYLKGAASQFDANRFWIGGFGASEQASSDEEHGVNAARMLANAAKFKALTGLDIREVYQMGDEPFATAASRGAAALARLSLDGLERDPPDSIARAPSRGGSGGFSIPRSFS